MEDGLRAWIRLQVWVFLSHFSLAGLWRVMLQSIAGGICQASVSALTTSSQTFQSCPAGSIHKFPVPEAHSCASQPLCPVPSPPMTLWAPSCTSRQWPRWVNPASRPSWGHLFYLGASLQFKHQNKSPAWEHRQARRRICPAANLARLN